MSDSSLGIWRALGMNKKLIGKRIVLIPFRIAPKIHELLEGAPTREFARGSETGNQCEVMNSILMLPPQR